MKQILNPSIPFDLSQEAQMYSEALGPYYHLSYAQIKGRNSTEHLYKLRMGVGERKNVQSTLNSSIT